MSAPVTLTSDSALADVINIESWARSNRMTLNRSKTWEMLLCICSLAAPPAINGIRHKKVIKITWCPFQGDPRCWGKQVDNLLLKSGNRM